MAEIGVGRARITIDAAMLAAPIGVDRLVEGNVRRAVVADDRARMVERHMGLERWQFVRIAARDGGLGRQVDRIALEGEARKGLAVADLAFSPTIVLLRPQTRLIAAGTVADRPTPFTGQIGEACILKRVDRITFVAHGKILPCGLEQFKNKAAVILPELAVIPCADHGQVR